MAVGEEEVLDITEDLYAGIEDLYAGIEGHLFVDMLEGLFGVISDDQLDGTSELFDDTLEDQYDG